MNKNQRLTCIPIGSSTISSNKLERIAILILLSSLFGCYAFTTRHRTSCGLQQRYQRALLCSASMKPKHSFINDPFNRATAAKKRTRSKPNSRKLSNNTVRNSNTGPAVADRRPVLTEYEMNHNSNIIKQRLTEKIGCDHFGLCSGCVVSQNVANIDVIQSARLYFSSTSVRRKRIDVIRNGKDWATEDHDDGFYQVVVPSAVRGWRTQAKLVASPKSSSWAKDGCQFGLYERGTHKVLGIPNCAVHHPSINRAIQLLTTATAKVGTAAFNEQSREGGLRFVQCQVERTTGKVALTLIWNAETLKEAQPSLSYLVKELNRLDSNLWHSIWCHCNNGPGNNIFSRNANRWHRINGPEYIKEPLPVGEFGWLYFSPLTFRQGNLDGFDIIANDVARAIPGGSKVCELYAGVGLLGLTALAYHSEENDGDPLEWIRCSDENPSNLHSFRLAVRSLPPSINGANLKRYRTEGDVSVTLAELATMVASGEAPPQPKKQFEKAKYFVSSAGNALKSGQALGANLLIVDPPRKGLEEDVLIELCKPFKPNQPYVETATLLTIPDEQVNWTNDVKLLIYVSCGFDALARDCERLLSSQAGWFLVEAVGYVLFPGTDHVETLAIFQRE